MIQVEQVSKRFKAANVLRGISLDIKKGDYTAVMGPSGSGKSTLLYAVSGMDAISGGRVLFEGKDISRMREKELALLRLHRMGFVFQNAHMLKNLCVFDNITLPGLVARAEPAQAVRARALDLMKRMGIGEIREQDIREVSGGQLQRASICRAMINRPEILFLDEPTGALNSEATLQVLDILDELNRGGMTILMITHNPRVAARAGKVVYLIDGLITDSITFPACADRDRMLDDWLRNLRPLAAQ